MPFECRQISRRQILTTSLGAGLSLLPVVSLVTGPAVAANPEIKEMNLTSLIQSLRSIGKPVCLEAADRLAALLSHQDSFDLHLRSAGLEEADAQVLADGITRLNPDNGSFLRSFSASYNPDLGDDGVAILARAFPKTMTELGMVGCAMGDTGGRALIKWAQTAPDLQMICVEGNDFSADVRSGFYDLAGQGRRPLIVV